MEVLCPGERADGQGEVRYGTAVVLDVETTGLSPCRDEVIELAMALFHFDGEGNVIADSIEEYTGLREPSVPIPPEATRIHGLTMADVAGRRLDEDKVHSLAARADYFIAHNARFDRPFVERLLPDAFRGKTWLCTCHHVNWRAFGLPSKSLPALTRHFGIQHDDAHRALSDVRATLELLSRHVADGRTVLAELLGRQQRHAARRAVGD